MADDLNIRMEPFNAKLVEAVDLIVAIAKKNGSKGVVQTSQDWKTMKSIYFVYAKLFPENATDFEKSVKEFRKHSKDHGVGGDKGAKIQHNLEVPNIFYYMTKVIFPDQKWDTKFAHKISTELPQLKPITDGY